MDRTASFDIVIVGAGPAGCVLAHRLTEDPRCRVLLLEAGPDYGREPTAWPVEMRNAMSFAPDSHAWGHFQADRSAERTVHLSQARVVGGSSTINSCIWLRGSAADYDEWAAMGNPGWSFAELLPYFRLAETDPLGGPLHGIAGPVPVFRVTEADRSPVDRAVVAAAKTLGFPVIEDLNGDPVQRPGVGPTPRNVSNGRRMHAAWTYLAPARSRPNLAIISDVMVDHILFDRRRVVGVRTADGRELRGAEVILCAGAFGSPAILLRSGLGPAEHLRHLGITVTLDQPGVGQGLRDHPFLGQLISGTVIAEHAPSGPSSLPTMIKARSSQTNTEIDLHIYHGQFFDLERQAWVVVFSLSGAYARSHGSVRLSSTDPKAPLLIDHQHLAELADLEALCDGAELVSELASMSPLNAMIRPLPSLLPVWRNRNALRAAVRNHVTTTFHPSSTCRMGPSRDQTAVVDHEGRVHGVEGLRIADASIFPTGPRANLHATVVASAEKLADVIRIGSARDTTGTR